MPFPFCTYLHLFRIFLCSSEVQYLSIQQKIRIPDLLTVIHRLIQHSPGLHLFHCRRTEKLEGKRPSPHQHSVLFFNGWSLLLIDLQQEEIKCPLNDNSLSKKQGKCSKTALKMKGSNSAHFSRSSAEAIKLNPATSPCLKESKCYIHSGKFKHMINSNHHQGKKNQKEIQGCTNEKINI